jgi:hypothetical protein
MLDSEHRSENLRAKCRLNSSCHPERIHYPLVILSAAINHVIVILSAAKDLLFLCKADPSLRSG